MATVAKVQPPRGGSSPRDRMDQEYANVLDKIDIMKKSTMHLHANSQFYKKFLSLLKGAWRVTRTLSQFSQGQSPNKPSTNISRSERGARSKSYSFTKQTAQTVKLT